MTSKVCIKANCSYHRPGSTERRYVPGAQSSFRRLQWQRLFLGSHFLKAFVGSPFSHPGNFVKVSGKHEGGWWECSAVKSTCFSWGALRFGSQLPSVDSVAGDHTFFWPWWGTRHSDAAQTYVAWVYAQTYIHIHKVSESFLFKKNRQHRRLGRFSVVCTVP